MDELNKITPIMILKSKFMRPDNYLFDVINRAKFYPDRLMAQSQQI